jgi:hypothetical protein
MLTDVPIYVQVSKPDGADKTLLYYGDENLFRNTICLASSGHGAQTAE